MEKTKTVKNFEALYQALLSKFDLDPPQYLAAVEKIEISPEVVKANSYRLPLAYRQAYAKPLENNYDGVKNLDFAHDFFGAVYDHIPDNQVRRELRCFLAVNSNLYRSFMDAKRRSAAGFSICENPLPPLATFRRKCEKPWDTSPWTWADDAVGQILGGNVAVVVLPSAYVKHPLLWGILAHETAGHAVFHAERPLLSELAQGLSAHLRKVFSIPAVRAGTPMSQDQLLEVVWLHWLEESAAHVYAVLNLGPSFGKGLAVWMAVNIQRGLEKSLASSTAAKETVAAAKEAAKNPAENASEVSRWKNPKFFHAPMFWGFELYYSEGKLDDMIKKGKGTPWLSYEKPDQPYYAMDIDQHPLPPILQLYVVIGAIEALDPDRFNPETRVKYVTELEELAQRYMITENGNIAIAGYVKKGLDAWMEIELGKCDVPVDVLVRFARTVGSYIATAPLSAFNGHTIQDIETWDDLDQEAAKNISQKIQKGESIANAGDDAQLLAGALEAFYAEPNADTYDRIEGLLMEALDLSFKRDEIWGTTTFLREGKAP